MSYFSKFLTLVKIPGCFQLSKSFLFINYSQSKNSQKKNYTLCTLSIYFNHFHGPLQDSWESVHGITISSILLPHWEVIFYNGIIIFLLFYCSYWRPLVGLVQLVSLWHIFSLRSWCGETSWLIGHTLQLWITRCHNSKVLLYAWN